MYQSKYTEGFYSLTIIVVSISVIFVSYVDTNMPVEFPRGKLEINYFRLKLQYLYFDGTVL